MKPIKLAALSSVAVLAALPALAQTLQLLPSPDVPVAPIYPLSVPNSGAVTALINQVTGFGRTFGYGSSSTNTRRANGNINQNTPGNNAVFTEVNSNGHAIYIEMLSPLIGASNGRGSTFPPATNFADGGSNSVTALLGNPNGCTINLNCTLQPQVAQFQQVYGRYAPNDIVVQWSGINDWNVSNIRTQAQVDAILATNVQFQTEMVRQNLALGARNYAFIGLSDLGTFRNFTQASRNNDPALLTQGSLATNAQILPNLVALHNQTGANIHYFDSNLLVTQIRANPTAYGFAANGAAANVDCIQAFGTAAACASQPFNVQNQYMSLDGLHWTNRYHDIQALAIANQLVAPFTMGPQVELGRITATSFADTLFSHLNAYCLQNTPVQVQAAFSADLPGRAPPPATVPVALGSPVSLFAMGSYATGDRKDRLGSTGFDYDFGAITVGAEYRVTPNLLVGAAFNYANPNVNLNQWFGGSIDMKSYQFAGFASLSYPNWFVDAVVTYGTNRYQIDRPGVISPLTASPDGDALTAAVKAAYLFDIAPSIQVGPLVGLSYARTTVDAYREAGDALLVQGVNRQTFDGVTGSAGVQLRYSLPFFPGVRTNSFLNVTAEHDFRDGVRMITTFQTYAPALLINTNVGGRRNETYAKVASGISLDFTPSLSVMLASSATYGRDKSEDYTFNAGIKYRF